MHAFRRPPRRPPDSYSAPADLPFIGVWRPARGPMRRLCSRSEAAGIGDPSRRWIQRCGQCRWCSGRCRSPGRSARDGRVSPTFAMPVRYPLRDLGKRPAPQDERNPARRRPRVSWKTSQCSKTVATSPRPLPGSQAHHKHRIRRRRICQNTIHDWCLGPSAVSSLAASSKVTAGQRKVLRSSRSDHWRRWCPRRKFGGIRGSATSDRRACRT